MSGYRRISVVDLDTIDVSNLNRQFMFRQEDVGRFKSEVAAEYVTRRRPNVKIVHYTKKLQEMGQKTICNHNVVVSCLDNNEARLYLNDVLVDGVRFEDPISEATQTISANEWLVKGGYSPSPSDALVRWQELSQPDPETVPILVDGGTEGWRGHVKVSFPMETSCVQCASAVAPPANTPFLAICTIANVPRTPEHCVLYAQMVLWRRLEWLETHQRYRLSGRPARAAGDAGEKGWETFTGGEDVDAVEMDSDNEEHMTWLWARACERARHYKIGEPSYADTVRVVKGVVPAVGTTNALVSALGLGEALKESAQWLRSPRERYWAYLSDQYSTGTNTQVVNYNRLPACPSCRPRLRLVLPRAASLRQAAAAAGALVGTAHPVLRDRGAAGGVLPEIFDADRASHQAVEAPASATLEEGRVYEVLGGHARRFQVVYE